MEKNIKMKELSEWERPYEKCLIQGPEALSETELLSVLLGSGGLNQSAIGLSRQIWQEIQNAYGRNEDQDGSCHLLKQVTLQRLMSFNGIGPVKAARIAVACELGKRMHASRPKQNLSLINRPELVAAHIIPEIGEKDHEVLYGLFLNCRNRLIAKRELSRGSLSKCHFSARDIFRAALQLNAASIILAHNHPSGELTPSDADWKATEYLVKLGFEMGLPVYDHLLVSGNSYKSMRESNPRLFELQVAESAVLPSPT